MKVSVTSDAANVPVAGVAIEPASLILCEGGVRAPLVTTTVMVVLPGWFPRVTTPVTGAALAAVDAVTVATLGSELFHSTLSMVASSGISLGVYSPRHHEGRPLFG